MTSAPPVVSLCVPTYGRASYIGATLTSAINQTFADFEIIVVDDVSPDNTGEVVAGFADPRIRYLRNTANLGVPKNLNYVMSLARGEFMVLLEDHDLLEPTYLQEMLAALRRHPTAGFAASGLVTIDDQSRPVARYVCDLPDFMTGRTLLRRLLTRTDCPFSVTTMVRRSVCEGVAPLFDAKYWWYADQFLWLRLAAKSDFAYVAKPLLRFRDREPDHYLIDRVWESMLCVDRIHRDTWRFLHPSWSPAAMGDWLHYETAKFKSAVAMQAGRRLRGEAWTAADVGHAREYLAAPSALLLQASRLMPVSVLARIRKWHHDRATAVTAVSAGVRQR